MTLFVCACTELRILSSLFIILVNHKARKDLGIGESYSHAINALLLLLLAVVFSIVLTRERMTQRRETVHTVRPTPSPRHEEL